MLELRQGARLRVATKYVSIAREFFAIAGKVAQKLAIAEHKQLPVLQ